MDLSQTSEYRFSFKWHRYWSKRDVARRRDHSRYISLACRGATSRKAARRAACNAYPGAFCGRPTLIAGMPLTQRLTFLECERGKRHLFIYFIAARIARVSRSERFYSSRVVTRVARLRRGHFPQSNLPAI